MEPTSPSHRPLTRREIKDLKILAHFTATWCRARHQEPRAPLRPEGPEQELLGLHRFPLCTCCRDFLAYAMARRLHCPLDPKPSCKHCPVHCYRPGHREQVREIMRFSGRRLLLRGRLDLLWHYFF